MCWISALPGGIEFWFISSGLELACKSDLTTNSVELCGSQHIIQIKPHSRINMVKYFLSYQVHGVKVEINGLERIKI